MLDYKVLLKSGGTQSRSLTGTKVQIILNRTILRTHSLLAERVYKWMKRTLKSAKTQCEHCDHIFKQKTDARKLHVE